MTHLEVRKMKITKQTEGWLVIPSTSLEESHLEFLLEALNSSYAKGVETKGFLPAIHLSSLGRSQHKVSQEE